MTIPELEELERKMLAAMEAERTGKVIDAPTTTTTNNHTSFMPESGR
jgi:hypothetical protein